MAWDGGFGRRRLFVEDARHNGQFLRVTWHADRQQFVVSNWEDTVCVGATRVPVADAVDLIGLLTAGLGEAVAQAPPAQAEPRTLVDHLRDWWRGRGQQALVLPLRSRVAERRRRSA